MSLTESDAKLLQASNVIEHEEMKNVPYVDTIKDPSNYSLNDLSVIPLPRFDAPLPRIDDYVSVTPLPRKSPATVDTIAENQLSQLERPQDQQSQTSVTSDSDRSDSVTSDSVASDYIFPETHNTTTPWKHVVECIRHEMSSMISSVMEAVVTLLQVDIVSNATAVRVLSEMQKRISLSNAEAAYIRAAIKRAVSYKEENNMNGICLLCTYAVCFCILFLNLCLCV